MGERKVKMNLQFISILWCLDGYNSKLIHKYIILPILSLFSPSNWMKMEVGFSVSFVLTARSSTTNWQMAREHYINRIYLKTIICMRNQYVY